MRASLVRVTLCVVLGLLLAGCGGDPSPTPAPYKKSPTTSASPTGPPSMPAEAKGTTEASAKAFVGYYFRALSYAAATGDVANLKALGTPECQACDRLVTSIRRTYASGGKAVGRGYESQRLRLSSDTNSSEVLLEGVVRLYPQTSYASAGATPKHSKGGPANSRMQLRRTSGGWLMNDWYFL